MQSKTDTWVDLDCSEESDSAPDEEHSSSDGSERDDSDESVSNEEAGHEEEIVALEWDLEYD